MHSGAIFSYGDKGGHSEVLKFLKCNIIGIFWDSEGVYEGQFKNSVQDGYGVYKYNDGTVYTGQFQDGERHGKGKIEWGKSSGGGVHEGEWVQGKQVGN